MQLLLNQTAEIENMKQQSTNDRSITQSLQDRVFFLEAELKNISQRFNDAVQVLDDLKLKDMSSTQLLLNQSVELEQQSAKDRYSIHLLQNETQRLVRNLDDLKVQVRYTSLSLLDVHSMTEKLNGSLVQRLEERISDVHDHITNVSKRIGFTATVSSLSATWSSGTLVYDVVITNVGNGYNPSTGVFTAPTAGEYVFFVNVQSYSTQSIYVDVVLNGVTKVRTMAYSYGSKDYYDAGPNLVVLSLQKGDRVWVKHYSGKGYWNDGSLTTFSGFLL
uniref:Caprin-2 n=1 Tax=Magallana gigas TaxID=29159 RepID=K1RPF1_MAGGI